MKKTALTSVLLLALSPAAWALKMKAHVDSVDYGGRNQDHLLKLSNGRVVFVERSSGLLDSKTDIAGEYVELDVSEDNELLSISSLPEEPENPQPGPAVPMDAEQTDLPSDEEASRIFRGMNRTWKSNTECTDRAQVWAYEEYKKNDLVSRKAFLFFTNTYIRRYRYHWWFHVSPYVLVQGTEKIMDRRYTSGPRQVKTWTDIFIRSKRSCPVNTYRYFRANRNGPEHCVLVKADMYYRLPYHVRMLEDYGRVKTQFSKSEVNFSYRAFRRRGVR